MPATQKAKPPSLKQLRKEVDRILRIGAKVVNYRKDVLAEKDLIELQASLNDLQQKRRNKHTTPIELEPALNRVEGNLTRHGGKIYPKHGWNDNVEMLLVATIVVLGIRTFFLQPFIIPTNSMYPTYSGMTFAHYSAERPAPAAPLQVVRFVTRGARHHELKAPVDGEVFLPVVLSPDGSQVVNPMHGERVQGRNFLILPARRSQYTFLIGPERVPASIKVPVDAQFTQVLKEAFFQADSRNLTTILDERLNVYGHTGIIGQTGARPEYGGRSLPVALLGIGQSVDQGEDLVNFDILLGDALFVDRMSYHFVRPKIGDPFVFRTENIPAVGTEQYYIKRLVGRGGDRLKIEEPVLLRNGEPISGSMAFRKNASRQDGYDGYDARGYLADGRQVLLPDDTFWAMGDNSDNSQDSRLWGYRRRGMSGLDPSNGYVPEDAVVGRAVFIYYPFTGRWGPAK